MQKLKTNSSWPSKALPPPFGKYFNQYLPYSEHLSIIFVTHLVKWFFRSDLKLHKCNSYFRLRLCSLEAITGKRKLLATRGKNRNGGQQSESLSLRQMFIGPTRLRQILQDLIQNLNGISNLDPFIHVIHWDWFCFSLLSQNHHRRLFRKFCRHMFIGPTKLRHILPDILQKLSKVLNNGWK